ncbi:MAG: alpha/beta hydrolase [Steroidobacteraceae bacterium]
MQTIDRYLRQGDVLLRYRDAGEGPAIVFIHGWTLDLELWEPQAARMSGSMRVLRHDRRGFGKSTGRPDPGADAGDLLALLDHVVVDLAVIVGMSQGARAALAVALQFPERVAGLVLDGPPDFLEAGEPESDDDLALAPFLALVRESGMDAFRRAWREHPLMRLHGGDPASRSLLDRMLARYPGADLAGPEPAVADPVDTAALARLTMPVLIVNGSHDAPARLAAGDRLMQVLPHAERAWIPGAGHLANLDEPVAYAEVLRGFLRRRSRAAA